MNEVLALLLPGGPAFVAELQRAWDAGDAVAPVDPRLPPAALDAALGAIAPTVVVDPTGRRLAHGRQAEPGDALIVNTSGTTGHPRAAVLTHDAVAASAVATSAALEVDAGKDRWLACLPLTHVGGLSVITRAMITGTDLEVHDGFDAEAVENAAARGATLVSLVATAARRINASLFRLILLGGSAIPTDRPANSVATYGMTETGGGVVYDGVPLDGVEVRSIGGELQLRCEMLMRGYRDGTNPITADGWYGTGDSGRVVDGIVQVDGRIGDVIVTGGEKVWPGPVERVLARDPRIREVAVVGRPDHEWGHVVTAVLVPADPSDPPDLDYLKRLVRADLPSRHAPRRLELVDSLPRTAIGKIRRDLL